MFFVLIYTLFGSHANFVEGKSLPYNGRKQRHKYRNGEIHEDSVKDCNECELLARIFDYHGQGGVDCRSTSDAYRSETTEVSNQPWCREQGRELAYDIGEQCYCAKLGGSLYPYGWFLYLRDKY